VSSPVSHSLSRSLYVPTPKPSIPLSFNQPEPHISLFSTCDTHHQHLLPTYIASKQLSPSNPLPKPRKKSPHHPPSKSAPPTTMPLPIPIEYLISLIILGIAVLVLSIALAFGIRHTCRQRKLEDAERTSQRSDLYSVQWNNSDRTQETSTLPMPAPVMQFAERLDAPEGDGREHPDCLVPGSRGV